MIGAELLSPQTLTVGWLIYVPVLLWAIWRAPWVESVSYTHLTLPTNREV